MDKVYTMSDYVNIGKNKKIAISDVVKMKEQIFNLIKKGFRFDDEVLKEAHIKKTISDIKVYNEIAPRTETSSKAYGKESESLKNILKSLNILDNQTVETTTDRYKDVIDNTYLDEEDEAV